MAIQINGDGTITGISVGGLPDGIVDTDMIAANAVATAKIADNAVTSAKSTISGGITHAQTWRRGSFTGTADPITGYTKYTSTNHGSLGADMTETNRILRNVVGESKKLREQNEFLMNKLIRKQDNLALANT